jgi:phosphoglucosamine mutase
MRPMPEGNRKRLFGTDGIRGLAGEFPLDEKTVEIAGRALAKNLARELAHAPRIAIGRDTRQSGPAIENALARGAASAGASVESAGVITTPGVAFVTKRDSFDAGVVISASHNPYDDNGIKVFTPSGRKLSDEIERRIEADIYSMLESDADKAIESNDGHLSISIFSEEAERKYREEYIDYLVDEIGQGLRLDSLHIGLDCANGAASDIAPKVFERLGAKLEVIYALPDGRNINEGCGSLHMDKLRSLVVERGLDAGIAFDGDADRALMLDGSGSLVDGDREMLILAGLLKTRGLLSGNVVVATVMSNIGLEIALGERGIEMVRAPVGDRFVLEELLAREAKLGGEQSGHIILPDIGLAGDGIVTAIEVLRAVKESGRSLDELASEMKTFPQVLVNVKVKSKPPIESLPDVQLDIERLEREMQGRGRLLVRYSGTENLARVMIEGEDQKTIENQAHRLAEVIARSIG